MTTIYKTKYNTYLQSLNIGDDVYPCYNGKLTRATVCKVTSINGNNIPLRIIKV